MISVTSEASFTHLEQSCGIGLTSLKQYTSDSNISEVTNLDSWGTVDWMESSQTHTQNDLTILGDLERILEDINTWLKN